MQKALKMKQFYVFVDYLIRPFNPDLDRAVAFAEKQVQSQVRQ
jgi:hypothetical protein